MLGTTAIVVLMFGIMGFLIVGMMTIDVKWMPYRETSNGLMIFTFVLILFIGLLGKAGYEATKKLEELKANNSISYLRVPAKELCVKTLPDGTTVTLSEKILE